MPGQPATATIMRFPHIAFVARATGAHRAVPRMQHPGRRNARLWDRARRNVVSGPRDAGLLAAKGVSVGPLDPETRKPALLRGFCLLGYLDSNQEQLNQNQPCCQLHHTPRASPQRGTEGQVYPTRERSTNKGQSEAASARKRASERSLPSNSIDSNSGGETRRPVTATRGGPKATRGFSSICSTSACESAS